MTYAEWEHLKEPKVSGDMPAVSTLSPMNIKSVPAPTLSPASPPTSQRLLDGLPCDGAVLSSSRELVRVDSSVSSVATVGPSGTPTGDIYFYPYLTPDLWFKEPWGYFHDSTVPLPADAPIPVVEDEKPYYDTDDEVEGDDTGEGEGENEDGGEDEDDEDEESVENVENHWYSVKYMSTMSNIRGFIW